MNTRYETFVSFYQKIDNDNLINCLSNFNVCIEITEDFTVVILS
jgi:hypothetical protein